ncbi:MAG: LiaF domain-containing protein [Ginsengibacter sp.]
MDQNDIQQYGGKRSSRVWSGLILLTAGGLLLAYKLGADIPHWIFSWPVLLILIGFISGIKSNFHNAGAFIMMIIGGVFLVDKIEPQLNFHDFIVPALLIGIGLIFILKPKRGWGDKKNWQGESIYSKNITPANYYKIEDTPGISDPSEHVEINTVFGGIKKNIISKNFKGGEINNFMGGTELNLLQADMQHPVILEVHNVFGGTKLIIPSNWDVKNEVTAVFGGIEDKRNMAAGVPQPDKVIILKGACVFGGIEVTNY